MMAERNDWSISIGRWLGVPVRLHVFFLLAVLVAFALEWQHLEHTRRIAGSAIVFSLALFLSVLAHELTHLLVALKRGGSVDTLILTPWGGLSEFKLPADYRTRTVVHTAGILFNLTVFLLGWLTLAQSGLVDLEELVNPIHPPAFQWDQWHLSCAMILTWVNFQLLILNLIPCFPFDGGELIRTMFVSVNSELGDLKIESTVKAIGQLNGAVFIGIAVLLRNHRGGPIEPIWAVLLGMGIVIFFCARYDFRRRIREAYDTEGWNEDGPLQFDTAAAYAPQNLDFLAGEDYSQWLTEKRQERERVRHELDSQLEKEEESVADQILSKLHERGLSSLSADERGLLERVSARLRNKRQMGSVDGTPG